MFAITTPPSSQMILKLRKHLHLRPLKLPHNRLPPCLRTRRNSTPILLRANQKPLTIPRQRIKVRLKRATILIQSRLDVKGPDDLSNSQPQVPFRDVDPRADPPRGAVGVVVALLVVRRGGELGGEGRLPFVVVRIEDVWVREAGLVMVQPPGVDDDCGSLRYEELAIDPVICEVCQLSHMFSGGKGRGADSGLKP